jgi:hypothetical protein
MNAAERERAREMSQPKQGTDLYTVWFWIRNMKHLRSYATASGLGDTADLHEDLRELGYEDAIAALGRIEAALLAALDENERLRETLEIWIERGEHEPGCSALIVDAGSPYACDCFTSVARDALAPLTETEGGEE